MINQLITPAPSFNQPLDLLSACHRKIRGFTETLLKLPAHLLQKGTDTEARQAATGILKYFDTAGQNHHEDEEQNLFPMLQETAAQQGNSEILALLEDLLAQHSDMNQAWIDLRPYLLALSQGETININQMPAQHFAALYNKHIPLEENFLLPYAERALNPSQLEVLGRAMATRRGVAF